MNWVYKRLLITIFCSMALFVQATDKIFIVIHGTWAHTWAGDTPWFVPGGDFFDALEKSARQQNAKVITLPWSAKLSHVSRMVAAQSLKRIIQSYPSDTSIFIASHSHGTNVAHLASHLMANDPHNTHKITAIYGLGTPVIDEYMPNMNVVSYFFNFFSFADGIQSGLGICGREYVTLHNKSCHERIFNIRTTINGAPADHYSIHAATIGRWIPHLHDITTHLTPLHTCTNHYLMHFTDTDTPLYHIDHLRDNFRILDQENNKRAWKNIVRKIAQYNISQFPLSPTYWHPEKLKDFVVYYLKKYTNYAYSWLPFYKNKKSRTQKIPQISRAV